MALKVRFKTSFPAQVQAVSPILLSKVGSSYTFNFDAPAAFSNLNLTNISLSAATFLGSTSGVTIVKSSAAASGALTLPAATDTLVGRSTTDTLSNKSFSGPLAVTSTSAAALAVGANGATNPVLAVDSSAASQASGISIKGNAAGGGTGISVIDSVSNSPLALNALGSGTITLGNASTGNIVVSRALNYGGVTLNNAVTGTGNMVLSTSPVLTTPNLGTPSALNLSNATSLPTTALTGALQAAQEPAHTGDMTNTAGSLATTVTKINGVDQTTSWTTYTPSVSAQTGTITTSSATGRYKQIGKTVFLQASVTITTAGTGTANLIITLPLTAASNDYLGASKEVAMTGKNGAAQIPAATPAQLWAIDSSGTTYIANGNRVVYSIAYELP